MTRLFLLMLTGSLITFIFLSKSVIAQNPVSAGLKIGLGVSSLHDNGYGANKMHAHIGVPVNFKLNKNFELQTAALISSKGYTSSFYKPEVRLKLNYVDLIATLKFFPSRIFFIGGGVYTSALLYSHYRYLAYSNDYYGEPDISNSVNKFDYGLNGSLGCQFENGVGFEFSVAYGLQDVFNSNISDTLVGYSGNPFVIPSGSNGKNMIISTSFYYLFGKKKMESSK